MSKKQVKLDQFEQLLVAQIESEDPAASAVATIYLFEHRANPNALMFTNVVTAVFDTKALEARLRACDHTFSDVLANLEEIIQTAEEDCESQHKAIQQLWTNCFLKIKLSEIIEAIIFWFENH